MPMPARFGTWGSVRQRLWGRNHRGYGSDNRRTRLENYAIAIAIAEYASPVVTTDRMVVAWWGDGERISPFTFLGVHAAARRPFRR